MQEITRKYLGQKAPIPGVRAFSLLREMQLGLLSSQHKSHLQCLTCGSSAHREILPWISLPSHATHTQRLFGMAPLTCALQKIGAAQPQESSRLLYPSLSYSFYHNRTSKTISPLWIFHLAAPLQESLQSYRQRKVEDLRLTFVHLSHKTAKVSLKPFPKVKHKHSAGGTKTPGGEMLLVWQDTELLCPWPSTGQPPCMCREGERKRHSIPCSSSTAHPARLVCRKNRCTKKKAVGRTFLHALQTLENKLQPVPAHRQHGPTRTDKHLPHFFMYTKLFLFPFRGPGIRFILEKILKTFQLKTLINVFFFLLVQHSGGTWKDQQARLQC